MLEQMDGMIWLLEHLNSTETGNEIKLIVIRVTISNTFAVYEAEESDSSQHRVIEQVRKDSRIGVGNHVRK